MSHEANGSDVGSVAEEAARLIGLLAWGLTEDEARAAGARASARTGVCETCGHDASAGATTHSGHGAPVGQRDPVCRLCPVCQVIAFVRGISPETIDRLADVVDMVSVGLRGLAETRREASATPSAAEPPPGAGP